MIKIFYVLLFLLCLIVKQKALQLTFFLLFLVLLSVFGKTAESLLANVLTLVTKDVWDQDVTDSLVFHSNRYFGENFSFYACGTWHGLFTVALAVFKKARETAQETWKQVSQYYVVDDRRFKNHNRKKSSW